MQLGLGDQAHSKRLHAFARNRDTLLAHLLATNVMVSRAEPLAIRGKRVVLALLREL